MMGASTGLGVIQIALKMVAAGLAVLILIVYFRQRTDTELLPTFNPSPAKSTISSTTTTTTKIGLPKDVSAALVHYATTSVTPQQTPAEIALSRQVLLDRGPCNFLVFGLGHDSLMWATLNRGGKTIFLEEDQSWIDQVGKNHPSLRGLAHRVAYPTQLKQADALMAAANSNRTCSAAAVNATPETSACPLALGSKFLPSQVLQTQWDIIMIDAPRGYFPEAPGRMTAIYTAALFARSRPPGWNSSTDIFVHDVDRPVEKKYCERFLCPRFRVAAAGRLWHFRVPPATSPGFCSA